MSDRPQIYNDIDAALRRGDIGAGMVLAREGLDQGLRHPLLFQLRAAWHETENRPADACTDLETGLTMKPGDPRMLNALGRCRAALDDYPAAMLALRAALHADPRLATAHQTEGMIWEEVGEPAQALAAYERALAIDPELSDAAARLAFIAAQNGDTARARSAAAGVLARMPHHPVAAFAYIAADLAEGQFAQAEARARKIMTDPRTTPEARVHALAYTADALDGQGKFDDAMRLYRQAKDGLAEVFHDRPGAADGESGVALARRLAGEMTPLAGPAQWEAPADHTAAQADGIVFLVGFPHSGTQMLARVLAGHSRALVLNDRNLLAKAAEEFVNAPGGLARLAKIEAAHADKLRGEFWSAVRDLGADPRGKVLVDQSAANLFRLPLIAKLFPKARVVFARRDPRDVALDGFRAMSAVSALSSDLLTLDGTARFYDAAMQLEAQCRAGLQLCAQEFRHENLAADFDAQTRALCDFAGLEWEAGLRDFANRPGQRVERGSHWQNYATALTPVLPTLRPWIETFGYA